MRCSGPRGAWRRASCGPRSRTTCSSQAGRTVRRPTTARSSCCSTTRTARSRSCRSRRSRSCGACTAAGEGQYLVNRSPVRRTDLVELLADVGLGGQMGSIISQGRVEEILGSKPEERRLLVEEAAGLGRFKRRRHRAELKLARVAIDVERARDLEAEVKKRLRPLALQATAAERAEKLRGRDRRDSGADRTARAGRVEERPHGRRNGARRPRSPATAPRRSSKACSWSATASRASSSGPRVDARRRPPPSTG